MAGTTQDISAWQAAVVALRTSEEQYRRIVENTSEGVWTYDAASITTFMNARMAGMLGYTVAEAVGLPVSAFEHPSEQPDDRAHVMRRRNGLAERSDQPLLRKDGTEVWTSIQSNPILDSEGTFEAGLLLVTDISAQRRADDTRAHLAAIVESSEDAIMSVNLTGEVTSWNLGAETLYQYRADEAIGCPLVALLPEATTTGEQSEPGRALRGGLARHYESTHLRKDGTAVDVAVITSPVKDARGNVIGASRIVQDLTARRAAEAVHRHTEEQFRQAQKMEAVGRLAGGVAHDFNNLLSVILSYTQFALDDLKPGDPLHADMSEIHQGGVRATELTKQLLAFSRQQMLQPQVIDINRIVVAMQRMLARIVGEDVVLTLHTAPTLGHVYSDPGQIEQVLMNLAVNARDAMPGGGSLSIETSEVQVGSGGSAELGPLSDVPPGDYILLAVSDTGTGMDAATRARIFEPFFTTKLQGKGTGLGLSTVFGIVQQSGGHVRVESELNRGTTFAVYLPATKRRQRPITASPDHVARRGSETILLVEDEEQVRTVVCATLRRNGYHVLDSSNGGEAFLISKDYAAKIDLLLTDVVMPRMSGRKLAETLAEHRPEMKVLYASGYTDDAIVHHGVLEAGLAFIQKPFVPSALLRAVREILDAPSALAHPGAARGTQ